MDKLRELLLTFTEEELEEFSIFLNRHRIKEDRKDALLVNYLVEDEYSGDELIEKLYRDPSKKDAYHTLRKRLFRQITFYVMLKAMEEDHSAAGPLMGQISLSKYLIQHNCYDLGWKYLKKAQKIAESSDQFNLLHEIYLLELEYWETNPKENIDKLLSKIVENKVKKEEEERFLMAFAKVRERLILHKKEMHFELEKDIEAILRQFNVNQIVDTRPKFLYRLIEMVRSAKMTKKQFYEFEPYVEGNYNKLKSKGFEEKDWEYQAGILYILIHAKFRNKKFDEAQVLNQELEEVISKMNRMLQSKFWPKMKLISAALYAYQGNAEKANEEIDEILCTKLFKIHDTLLMTALLNKSIYLFFLKEFKKANKIHVQFPFSEKEVEKTMGKEWAMKKALIQIVFQFELENHELVITKVRNFQRNFAAQLKLDLYARVKNFSYVIRDLATDPRLMGDKKLWEEVDAKFDTQGFEREDLQAMTFYAWLRAKINKKDFYGLLLEHINLEGKQEKYL